MSESISLSKFCDRINNLKQRLPKIRINPEIWMASSSVQIALQRCAPLLNKLWGWEKYMSKVYIMP